MPRKPPCIVPCEAVPLDEPFAVNAAFHRDTFADKVNLSIGVYRDEDNQPWPLASVEQAEKTLLSCQNPGRHEYLPIQGDVQFLSLSKDLVFSLNATSRTYHRDRERTVSAQTVSGTGANHIGAAYVARFLRPNRVWLPNVSWGNHYTIWYLAGVEIQTYPYYNEKERAFDFYATVQTLNKFASAGDIVLFHACAHNPTGCDPSKDEWRSLASLCHRGGLIPFFDMAYQGFASGDPVEDGWAVNYFFTNYPSLEFLVAQSYSKNFGLYGQRAGALHVVFDQEKPRNLGHNIESNLCNLIRGEFSMAPRHGSDIVREVLSSPTLKSQWLQDLKTMSGRIKEMRTALHSKILGLGTPGDWSHIVKQKGMFTYTGLSQNNVQTLADSYHIYMLSSGRVSISSLNEKNVDSVAQAINSVVDAP